MSPIIAEASADGVRLHDLCCASQSCATFRPVLAPFGVPVFVCVCFVCFERWRSLIKPCPHVAAVCEHCGAWLGERIANAEAERERRERADYLLRLAHKMARGGVAERIHDYFADRGERP